MTNTVLKKPKAKVSKTDVSPAPVNDDASLKAFRRVNMENAAKVYTGGGTDALDQFRSAMGFVLGAVLVMPPDQRAATTPELLMKTLVDTLDNVKRNFIAGEPTRLAQMVDAMEKREAIVAAENAHPVG